MADVACMKGMVCVAGVACVLCVVCMLGAVRNAFSRVICCSLFSLLRESVSKEGLILG